MNVRKQIVMKSACRHLGSNFFYHVITLRSTRSAAANNSSISSEYTHECILKLHKNAVNDGIVLVPSSFDVDLLSRELAETYTCICSIGMAEKCHSKQLVIAVRKAKNLF